MVPEAGTIKRIISGEFKRVILTAQAVELKEKQLGNFK
jgi:hypothetical protein